MTASSRPVHLPPPEVLATLDVAAPEDLGGRINHHWLVRRGSHPLVLRRVPADAIGDLSYELRLLDQLKARGWPAAPAVEPPIAVDGAIWCLFQRLPGTPIDDNADSDQRERGRLLASLHNDMEELVGLGQRSGWSEVRQVVEDEALIEELRRYERFFPEEANILRWHAERARSLFNEIDGELATARRLVLHGDFAPWNLLYEDGQLTGILDFEFAHYDLAVADFALSWRGKYDGVIMGYEEVRPLTDLDWRSLTPVFWSWLFIGLAKDLGSINAGRTKPTRPEWSLRLLLRRSPLMATEAEPYPGLGV